jgi:hypothetical protein
MLAKKPAHRPENVAEIIERMKDIQVFDK